VVDFTMLVAVDAPHLEELRIVWPTWVRHAPDVLAIPLLLVFDDVSANAVWHPDLHWLHKAHGGLVTAPLSSVLPTGYSRNPATITQRERMLTGLVYAARHITTPWFLKLDTDTLAVPEGRFWSPDWFSPDTVLAAPRWGYTKPGHWLDTLDRWADVSAPGNVKPPRVMGEKIASSPRITSYAMWGRTDFARECLTLLGDEPRLPVPSQDTFCWFCAALLGRGVTRLRASQHCWRHAGGNRGKLERVAREVLS
jgi:hypothetical protein